MQHTAIDEALFRLSAQIEEVEENDSVVMLHLGHAKAIMEYIEILREQCLYMSEVLHNG